MNDEKTVVARAGWMQKMRLLTGCAWLLAAPAAWALDLSSTEEAGLVDAKTCQLETWMNHRLSGNEVWAVPVCGVNEYFELAVGAGWQRSEESGERKTGALAQAKFRLKEVKPDDWGASLVFGLQRNPGLDPGSRGGMDSYFILPLTHNFMGDRLSVTLDLGAYHDRQLSETRPRAVLGGTFQIDERWSISAETTAERHNRPNPLAMVHYWLIPERMQMDLAYSDVGSGGQGNRTLSVGVRVLFPELLP